jgi:hypothetical protein
VRRIFQIAAFGHGSRHIAHVLNEQGVPTPRAQRGRPSGWDQGTIRAVLERVLYRGVIEYGKTKKRDAWGRKKIAARPASDLIRVEKPELRIISVELAAAVDAIRSDRRERYLRSNDGRLIGRPVLGKYHLSGMMRRPCGANFEAQKSPHGMRKGEIYVCAAHRRKGSAICANTLSLPIAETNERILKIIEGEVLSAAFIEVVLDTVFVPDAVDRAGLEAESDELERQLANLTAAVKAGGDIPGHRRRVEGDQRPPGRSTASPGTPRTARSRALTRSARTAGRRVARDPSGEPGAGPPGAASRDRPDRALDRRRGRPGGRRRGQPARRARHREHHGRRRALDGRNETRGPIGRFGRGPRDGVPKAFFKAGRAPGRWAAAAGGLDLRLQRVDGDDQSSDCFLQPAVNDLQDRAVIVRSVFD